MARAEACIAETMALLGRLSKSRTKSRSSAAPARAAVPLSVCAHAAVSSPRESLAASLLTNPTNSELTSVSSIVALITSVLEASLAGTLAVMMRCKSRGNSTSPLFEIPSNPGVVPMSLNSSVSGDSDVKITHFPPKPKLRSRTTISDPRTRSLPSSRMCWSRIARSASGPAYRSGFALPSAASTKSLTSTETMGARRTTRRTP
eukprot:6802106-Prymnesium_polylepis.1